MKMRGHFILLLQAVAVWGAFWLAGLPSYYQQYAALPLAVACVLLSVCISLAAVTLLVRVRPARRLSRAFWLSLYYTVPFATLDALYCGWYLGHGVQFIERYWYLSVFYVTPWLTFMPTALVLRSSKGDVSNTVSRSQSAT